MATVAFKMNDLSHTMENSMIENHTKKISTVSKLRLGRRGLIRPFCLEV